jgi:3-hydroxypropanoate dehydrogenase
MHTPINDHAMDRLFREARSFNGWKQGEVTDADIHAMYDLMKWGPTSANQSPARFYFIRSNAAKARLKPLLLKGNVEKTMTAPVCVIIATDMKFFEKLPQLFPHNPGAKDWFSSPEAAADNGGRNGTLQGAYLMLAARALGFDIGPMSGFDREGVDKEFFAGQEKTQHWRSNWLCNIGLGDPSSIFPRLPRLSFGEAAEIL